MMPAKALISIDTHTASFTCIEAQLIDKLMKPLPQPKGRAVPAVCVCSWCFITIQDGHEQVRNGVEASESQQRQV